VEGQWSAATSVRQLAGGGGNQCARGGGGSAGGGSSVWKVEALAGAGALREEPGGEGSGDGAVGGAFGAASGAGSGGCGFHAGDRASGV